MVMLLAMAGVTYVVLGDQFDAAIALGALVPISLVNAVLEHRSERALEQLKNLSAPTARVRRARSELVIPASEIVPGDIMLIKEGDIIAADGLLVSGRRLVVDESTLTGESEPAVKSALRPEGEREVLAGTTLLSGSAEVRVERTGAHTLWKDRRADVGDASHARSTLLRFCLARDLVAC